MTLDVTEVGRGGTKESRAQIITGLSRDVQATHLGQAELGWTPLLGLPDVALLFVETGREHIA